MKRPVALIILDGWGVSDSCVANAVCQAQTPRGGARSQSQAAPEKLVFDKAEEAETIEALRQRRTHVVQQIDDLTARLKEAEPEAKNKIERELNRLESTAATLKRVIELREQRSTDD